VTRRPDPTSPTPPERPGALPVPTREVELKLLAHPGDLARLAAAPLPGSWSAGPAETLRQRTTYFDTDGLELAAHGVALRVRREGKRCVQAVKTLGRGAGEAAGLAVRREWEWPIAGDAPDLEPLRAGELRGAVPQEALDRLRPVFTTDVRRTVLRLRPSDGTEIEMALDAGHVTAHPPAGSATAHRAIAEVELELKAGRVAGLFEVAAVLNRHVPLRLSARSKADEGFALLTGRGPAAVRAKPLGLGPASTAAECFRQVVRNCLAHLLDNEAAVTAGADPEALREMAAAVRRLEAAFRLFKGLVRCPRGAGLRKELRWLGRRLEAARAQDRLAQRLALLPATAVPAVLAAALARARRDARLALLEALHGPRCTALLLGLAGWLEGGEWRRGAALDAPMSAVVPGLLDRRLAKVRRAAAGLDPADAQARARLWRRVMRLRYALDFCRGLFPPERLRPALDAVDALRAALKPAVDLDQALSLLADCRARPARAALKALEPRLRRQLAREAAALPAALAAFRGMEPFWAAG